MRTVRNSQGEDPRLAREQAQIAASWPSRSWTGVGLKTSNNINIGKVVGRARLLTCDVRLPVGKPTVLRGRRALLHRLRAREPGTAWVGAVAHRDRHARLHVSHCRIVV
jgi:hypothetical protein